MDQYIAENDSALVTSVKSTETYTYREVNFWAGGKLIYSGDNCFTH